MLNFNFFLGIDASKDFANVALLSGASPKKYKDFKFDQNANGFKSFLKWLLQQSQNDLSKLFVCVEHTGIYIVEICNFLEEHEISYTLISPIALKRSLGLQRGKSDKVDARRIATYAFKNRDDLPIHRLATADLRELQALVTYRKRLQKSLQAIRISAKELALVETFGSVAHISADSERITKELAESMKQVEQKILALIDTCQDIKKKFDIIKTVPGVGWLTAISFIIYTQNFVAFTNPRKFACYAGTAPFEHSSGSSIRGKTGVSQMANKKMKTLLTTSAWSAINHYSEFSDYFNKKVDKKGKNKFSVLNAIRNKIIHRVFAVVRKNKAYVPA